MNRTRLSPHALFVLGTLGGFNSNAFHVDDGGQIVGASITGTPDPHSFLGESVHPFIWQNGVMQDLVLLTT